MKLKDDLVKIFLQRSDSYVQIYTVAHAWILFERLVYKNAIRKHNSRIYLSVCMLISIKLIELYGGVDKNKDKLYDLNADLKELTGNQLLKKPRL
jgi:hypothetical protein